MESIERLAGKASPLGFTPLLSSTSGGILRYDFKDLGKRVIDKTLHGHNGTLQPDYPRNSPRRRLTVGPPPRAILAFDGEDDFVETPCPNCPNGDFDLPYFKIVTKVKFPVLEDDGIIISHGDMSDGFFIRKHPAFGIECPVETERDHTYVRGGKEILKENTWHKIELIKGREEATLKIDDEEVNTAVSRGPNIYREERPLTLGRISDRLGFFLNMQMAWIEIYRL